MLVLDAMMASAGAPAEDDSLMGSDTIDRMLAIDNGPVNLRRWDAAQTHRLNAAQFENVTGQTLNHDLVTSLPTLMTRCAFEATTNPTIEGMIDTHAIDVIGPDGPRWQIWPKDPTRLKGNQSLRDKFAEYRDAAEELLQDWFAMPDLNGDLSGVDILTMDIHQMWTAGNSVVQIIDDESIKGRAISLRWHPIHAERVFNNYMVGPVNGSKNRVVLGVERTPTGRRVRYYVRQTDGVFDHNASYKFTPVRASEMIHRFQSREPGQICGVPVLASALPTIADIRQFDKLTMEAAKLGALFGLVFEDTMNNTPRSGPPSARRAAGVLSSVKAGQTEMMFAPAGKKVVQVKPEHPSNNYVEFRQERWRDVGRSSQMPLMMIRLGSEDHSFASARFDAQIYQRGIRRQQSAILRSYGPSMMDVLREGEIAGLIPMRPCQVELGGIFARLPHVDPKKEADARQKDLASMSVSLIDIWAEDGYRPGEMVQKLRDTVEYLNEVSDGLGDAWLFNNMNKNNPAVMDAFDDGEGSAGKTAMAQAAV